MEPTVEHKHFIEQMGLALGMVGLPRMAGRIFGWLLISQPPHQSTNELVEVLQASKGSISTMTRLLIQLKMIYRLSLPGERRDYFCIKPGAWSQMMKAQMAGITAFRQSAEKGLELLATKNPEHRLRLEEMRDFNAFWERELLILNQRWEEERQKNKDRQ